MCRVTVLKFGGSVLRDEHTMADAAREILRWRERMNGLIASHTNKTAEEIASDSDRDFYLTAQDALAYGIVDKVIEAKPID